MVRTRKTTPKPRSHHSPRSVIRSARESDGQYLLKLVAVILLGTFWLKFAEPLHIAGISVVAIPLGTIVGLLFISQFERTQENRKIWYAILFVVTIICSQLPAGIMV